MAIDSARAFFEALAARGRDARLTDAVGSWEFDVGATGTWTVVVDRGAIHVMEGPSQGAGAGAEPMTRLRADEAELVRLARGDGHENVLMALLRGALTIEGDLESVHKLQAILPITDEGSAGT